MKNNVRLMKKHRDWILNIIDSLCESSALDTNNYYTFKLSDYDEDMTKRELGLMKYIKEELEKAG